MQRFASIGEQALVKRVPYQRVLERKLARFAFRPDKIECLHRREPRIYVYLTDYNSQQFLIEAPSYYRGCLQEHPVISREAVNPSGQEALHACR